MDLWERRGMDDPVYRPAEDSRLLADAAIERLAGDDGDDVDLVLEVGTGSGFVAERVAETVGCRVIGTDVNPHACRRARDRGIETVRAHIVEPFRDEAFDAVLCNPPYLPTDPADARDDWMERALSGGPTGRAFIEPFLATVSRVLAADGIVLCLVSTLTDPDAVVELAGAQGFSAVAVADHSFPFETLTVLELFR